jgi:hypothetical protein
MMYRGTAAAPVGSTWHCRGLCNSPGGMPANKRNGGATVAELKGAEVRAPSRPADRCQLR